MAKETFTASIELTEDEAALVRETAEFFNMELAVFLDWALQSGIAHAEEQAAAGIIPVIDDGIPF